MIARAVKLERYWRLGGRDATQQWRQSRLSSWGATVGVDKSQRVNGGRYNRVGVAKSTQPKATWEDATPDDLWRTVLAVVGCGDAIMFGRTQDGGAVVVTILSGTERIKEYATGEDEVKSLLADIRASAEDDA